jgi:RHS repeat-associated protein
MFDLTSIPEVDVDHSERGTAQNLKLSGRTLSDIPQPIRAAFIKAVQQEAPERFLAAEHPDGYAFVNPLHDFRMIFDTAGVWIGSVKDRAKPRYFRINLIGYGYGNTLPSLEVPSLTAQSNEVSYEWDNFTTTYLNGRLGVEQIFTIMQPPQGRNGNAALRLELALEGDVTHQRRQGEDVQLKVKGKRIDLNYSNLFAHDSAGRALPATLTAEESPRKESLRLIISVDDRNAVYPITVDPLIQQAKLLEGDGALNTMYGEAVAIHGDTAVIGSYLADLPGATDAGAAYVFVRTGTTWTQQAKLTANDAQANDAFANSVGIYGDTIVVGADVTEPVGYGVGDDLGSLYVYVRSGTNWSLQQVLSASDAALFDHLGTRVAIHQDTIIASSQLDDHSSLSNAGSAYIFVRSGTTWTQQAKVTASDAASNDYFGTAVDVQQDTAIVGCGSKGVYVYVRNGSSWSQQAKLTASDGVAGTEFGYSARISGDSVIVGAFAADLPSKTDAGAAYVFVRSGTTWTQQAKLTASDAAAGDQFGWSVDINGDVALIGSPWADHSSKTNPGAAYVFLRSNTTWTQVDKVTASDANTDNRFGYFLAMYGTTAIIGAPSNAGLNQTGAAYIFTLAPLASPNSGAPSSTLSWAGEAQQDGAIAIRTGEKVETVTDLDVNTPVGAMTFTRTYRQSKRASYQYMGLGWTHNHAPTLTKTTGTPNTILVRMPNGGDLKLTETSAGSNTYNADGGSDAKVTYSTGTTQYTLTGSDKSTFVFDSAGKLLTRNWPTGETWTYTYTSSKLTSVDDGYGRGLQFSYVSNAGQYNDGQLWRVGDHQATGLTGGSPSGRYVEYAYTTQKSNGSAIGSPKALLYTVRDVMGNVWTHKYYGQVAGQSDSNQLDFLLETVSPNVDTTGAGSMSPITVEKLTYTTSGSTITNITRELGNSGISTSYAFQPGGQNLTEEVTAGLTAVHRFANGVYAGTEDPGKNYVSQVLNFQYRPEAVADAKGNRTNMEWTADGKLLTKVTDAAGNVTTYAYNTAGASADTLNYSLDPLGRKTQFTYGDSGQPRLPTRVQVYDKDGGSVVYWQEWTYDNKGRVLTEKLFDPANGTTVLRQTERTYHTSGNGNGLLQAMTVKDVQNVANDETSTYSYDGVGRVTKVQQSSLFGTCKASFAIYDAANRVVASLCNYENAGADPTNVAGAVALFSEATPEKNRVTTYEYDALGRQTKMTSDAGASYAQVMLTVYDSVGRVVRTIRNYIVDATITDPFVHRADNFRHGANNDRNLVEDMAYNERGMMRRRVDVAGRVTLYGYDDAGRMIRTVASASQSDYNNTYAAGGDPSLAKYAQMVALDAPDVDIIATMTYDAAGNVIATTDAIGNVTLTVYDALNRPVKVIRNASQPTYDRRVDTTLRDYVAVSDGDRDMIEVVEYDGVGRIRRTQDPFGEWTLYSYDAMDRPIRTVRNATRPTYNVAADPTLVNYVESSAVDRDLITQIAYDPAGRMMYSVDAIGRRDWVGYDGLWRIIRRIDNALGAGTTGGVNDPRAAGYQASGLLADRDQISYIEYDTDGRVSRTRDALGNWTLYGYDSINRPVKTIRNASNPAYNFAADPTLASYKAGVEGGDDQDIITTTRYDAQGRVAATVNPLKRETRYTYDTLGRTLKTIVNFHSGKFDAAYPDRDLVATTRYDVEGRVLATVDVRGTETRMGYDRAGRPLTLTRAARTPLTTTGYTCYDKAGRVLRTIANWKPTTASAAPDARDGQGNWLFAPSTHGSANDQNLITTFTLDKAGRALSVSNPAGNSASMSYAKDGQTVTMTDPLGVVTTLRYNRLRRQALTVRNYVANGEDPSLWKWNGSAWTKADGSTAIAFGTDKDQNILTATEYDKAGRRVAMRDPRGNRTTYAYDALDRRTQLTDPRGSLWATAYTHKGDGTLRMQMTDPLSNVIQTEVNRIGQVAAVQYLNESPKNTPDVFFSYDRLGNRLSMTEKDGATTVRKSDYAYDRANRMTSAAFDRAGDGTDVQTVTYAYDPQGRRTRLTLPGNLSVTYSYDARGRLTSLSDWSSQATNYTYDGVDRLATQTRSGLASNYSYNPSGWLTLLKHQNGGTTLGEFAYIVNARGDRTQAYEKLAKAGGGNDEQTIVYAYDGLARVSTATYYAGATTGGSPTRTYNHAFDIASNRTQQVVTIGSATTTDYEYDAANRITRSRVNAGSWTNFTYDNAGRLTSDGTNTYTWDRANRLLSMGGATYAYDGAGRRVSQTVGGNTTKYLLDVGMSLWETLVETTGANTTRYVHSMEGLLAQQRPDSSWQWMMNDGLGSLRGVLNSSLSPQESRMYAPFGDATQLSGTSQLSYGFTGEPTDGNGLVYLRGRYYHPSIGQFISLDPLETANRYGYVGGNVVNRVDPSGLAVQRAVIDGGGVTRKLVPTKPQRTYATPLVTLTSDIDVRPPVRPPLVTLTSDIDVRPPVRPPLVALTSDVDVRPPAQPPLVALTSDTDVRPPSLPPPPLVTWTSDTDVRGIKSAMTSKIKGKQNCCPDWVIDGIAELSAGNNSYTTINVLPIFNIPALLYLGFTGCRPCGSPSIDSEDTNNPNLGESLPPQVLDEGYKFDIACQYGERANALVLLTSPGIVSASFVGISLFDAPFFLPQGVGQTSSSDPCISPPCAWVAQMNVPQGYIVTNFLVLSFVGTAGGDLANFEVQRVYCTPTPVGNQ